MNVYLIWDHSRAEHGEGPSLISACTTREVADAWVAQQDEDEQDMYSIEERKVIA